MGAVTYPDANVAEFVMSRFVPIQVKADSSLADDFKITWTPTIIVLDYYGKEHHRTVGFFPPDDFIPSLLLGMGKADFDSGQFNDAIIHFDGLLSAYPKSTSAPEAVYLRGVSRFKTSHDAKSLKEIYEKLVSDYPGSDWVKRAEPYSLI